MIWVSSHTEWKIINASKSLDCFKFETLKKLDYSLLPWIQLLLSIIKFLKKWILSITTDGCCSPLIQHIFLKHPFHKIFGFIRLSWWFWLLWCFIKKEHFLVHLSLEILVIHAKKYKVTNWLASSPYGEAFLSWWSGFFLGWCCEWLLKGWMNKKTMWISYCGWGCQHFWTQMSM